jgi:hypothetical protein
MAWNYILVTFKTFSTDEWPLIGFDEFVVFATVMYVPGIVCVLLNTWHWQKLYVYGLTSDNMSISGLQMSPVKIGNPTFRWFQK